MLVHQSDHQPKRAGPDSPCCPQHRLRVRELRGQPTGMTWLDRMPLGLLVALAAWLAIAPITPEPHLVEKLRMLSQGTLTRPLDMFDLCLHSVPLLVLGWRLWRQFGAR